MNCPTCGLKITKENVVLNGFVDDMDAPKHIKNTLDIQIVCPDEDCETSLSHFVKDTDWTMDH